MGNCLRRQSSMQDEEWDLDTPEDINMHVQDYNIKRAKVEKIVVQDHEKTTTTSIEAAKEVKIKITKKQLEELLGRVDVKELSVEQVLVQLMDASTSKIERHHHHHNQQAWEPALQSIPE